MFPLLVTFTSELSSMENSCALINKSESLIFKAEVSILTNLPVPPRLTSAKLSKFNVESERKVMSPSKRLTTPLDSTLKVEVPLRIKEPNKSILLSIPETVPLAESKRFKDPSIVAVDSVSKMKVDASSILTELPAPRDMLAFEICILARETISKLAPDDALSSARLSRVNIDLPRIESVPDCKFSVPDSCTSNVASFPTTNSELTSKVEESSIIMDDVSIAIS